MRDGTWAVDARRVIGEALAAGEAAGLAGAELRKFVAARYPYGARECWPYKVWLREVRRAFPRLSREALVHSRELEAMPLMRAMGVSE